MKDTKLCPKCDNHKKLSEFYNRNKITKYSYCKDCFNKICVLRWINVKIKAIEYKGNKCIDCNIQYPYSVYDFHHLDPLQKDYDWNKLRLKSWSNITKELDKCVLLCSNCHRIRHHNMRSNQESNLE